MNDPNADEEARQKKAAENPLTSYFGGQSQKAAPAPTAQAPGQATAPPARATAAAPSTNVGAGASTQVSPTNSYVPPMQQQQRAPQPTNFTNFERYFNANKDASQRTAGALQGRAALQAGQAADALRKTQQQFGLDVAAGTIGAAPDLQAVDPGTGPTEMPTVPSAAAPQSQPVTQPNRSGYQPIDDTSMAAINGMTMAEWQAAGRPDASGQKQDALASQSTRPGASNDALTSVSTRPAAGVGLYGYSDADVAAKAGGSYTGPGGLGDVLGSQDAYDTAQRAQGGLNAMGTEGGLQALIQGQNPQGDAGTSKLSAGLVNAAGRGDFDALRARFNPTKDLNDAATAAGATADAARTTSATNAAGWGKVQAAQQAALGKQADANAANDANAKAGRDASAAAADATPTPAAPKIYEQSYGKDTPQNRQAYAMTGVDTSDPKAVAKRQALFDAYQKATSLTTQNQMDQSFNDFNSVMSPVNWATDAAGVRDPAHDSLQKGYGGGLSLDKGNQGNVNANTGSTNQDAIPWNKVGMNGFFVYANMSPDDWKTLNSKPQNGPNGQVAWINTRAAQLRDQKTPTAPSVGTSRSV